ncbi:sigma-54 interaction domain-containing protein [Vibrio kanaloae]|uniref:Sigma-54-dependent Fis family transcriptional regulator n=1 Tax=Vibrio kanaloae TaxID=170673 RepID=A0A4U1W9A6_9VIBR|nr:sigma-54 dependent transcriptional regulator [Vibrio kanaloae]TKE89858.1 sigma-54-dependent Fis family transcriptional regulator [Vibrio kanaloae]TKF12689.1 sigma-54-dependent Fis family transcriptional regulator [Vibrio kanaloae]TKF25156.1 sigma-54-dependent Fis family transcriptional regulator [Vibrio kanaloae]TKF75075.1 sigma-54-dependent Fis family transcriptional regulator [Vibrio kanaloae]
MSNWLARVTELIGIKTKSDLIARFVDIIIDELSLSNCMVLTLNSEGRRLVPHKKQINVSWGVDDLSNPFSQVLQNAVPMTLSSDALLFWQSDRAFTELVSDVGMFESVSIHPLPMHSKQVRMVLYMLGDHNALTQTFLSQDCIKFVDVFTKQWQLLEEMDRKQHDKSLLSESLNEMQRDTKLRNLADKLSQSLIGESNVMQRLRQQVVSAAESQLSIMIQGDTGTGKELVAQAIHRISSGNGQPLVTINCAAIPENLLESELFGYCKGAFSGAESNHKGLIAQADGGTLFLDEIGDMPILLQAKLLRVLETKQFRPIGGKEELNSEFRLVSATHVNLLSQVRNKKFRQDLYYRLLQYPLTLPLLSERLEDIAPLSQHFIHQFNQQHGTKIRGLHYRALDCLKKYSFPGNVRELKSLVEFGCAQCLNASEVSEDSLSHRIACMNIDLHSPIIRTPTQSTFSCKQSPTVELNNVSPINNLKQAMNDYEKQLICKRLETFSGDRTKTARSLGIPKRTLAYKCQKLEINT